MDQAQVGELYRRHVPGMRSLATLLLAGDTHRAEDIVHDAFIKAAAKLPSLRDHDRFEAYLRRCVVNASVSAGRRRSVERRWLARQRHTEGHPDRVLDQIDEADQIVELLRQLPPRQRLAVVARICLDLSEADTADLLGCSIGNVKSMTSRGLATLRVAHFGDPSLPDETDTQQMRVQR